MPSRRRGRLCDKGAMMNSTFTGEYEIDGKMFDISVDILEDMSPETVPISQCNSREYTIHNIDTFTDKNGDKQPFYILPPEVQTKVAIDVEDFVNKYNEGMEDAQRGF
jgi:hypothetical protein